MRNDNATSTIQPGDGVTSEPFQGFMPHHSRRLSPPLSTEFTVSRLVREWRSGATVRVVFPLCFFTVLCAGCTTSGLKRNGPIASLGTDLRHLFEAANSDAALDWMPAAEELAIRATEGRELRDLIWREARINSVGMKFVRLGLGSFIYEPHHACAPELGTVRHSVEIIQPVFIAVTECTNRQYAKLVSDRRPNRHSPDVDMPATGVSYEEAVHYAATLSEREGITYRLPTELEWEYACRAGSDGRYCFGDNAALLSEYAWWAPASYTAARVAIHKPNAWGIYDMHGNAYEWTSDVLVPSSFRMSGQRTAIGQSASFPMSVEWARVIRGGCWIIPRAEALSCGCRVRKGIQEQSLLSAIFQPDAPGGSDIVGFRLVREARLGE